MSSIDNPPPSFTCLVVNERAVQWFPKKTIGETTYLIISDVQYEDTLNSHHLRSVLGCNNKEGERSDHYCWACRSYKTGTTYFYHCNECNNYYHKECVESPPIFISSYHPKYPLQLLKYDRGIRRECLCCGLEIYGLVYHSSISDLFMDPLSQANKSFLLYTIQKGMSIPSITFLEKHQLLAMFAHLMIPKIASTLVFNAILLSMEDVSTCHTSYEYLVTATVFLLLVLFLSEILGFAEFVARRWMKTMDHILAQRVAPMQCTLTVLLCLIYGLVRNSRTNQSWKMIILSRRLRRWVMELYDILGMHTIA